MTKSKSFWAVLAVISLAAGGFSGYSIYNRLAIYLANDTVEIKSRPVPPLPDPEEPGEDGEKILGRDESDSEEAGREEKGEGGEF